MSIRSFLFVPGDSERKLAKGAASDADALILDLEDAVAPARKPAAREMVAEYLRSAARASELWVRINPLDQGGLDDLAAVVRAGPDGIVVPKADGPADVRRLGHYLAVSAILLVLGIFGIFLNRKNVIIIMMSIELILLAVNLNLVAFSAALGDLVGQMFALFVLTVAAAEAAIGLAIIVIYYRNRGSIEVEDVNLMKG